MKIFNAIVNKARCFFSKHTLRLGELHHRADLPFINQARPSVEGVCVRCGKILRNTYGLAMNVRWIR